MLLWLRQVMLEVTHVQHGPGDNFCCSATTRGESSAELGSDGSCKALVMDGRNEVILEVWAASCKVIT